MSVALAVRLDGKVRQVVATATSQAWAKAGTIGCHIPNDVIGWLERRIKDRVLAMPECAGVTAEVDVTDLLEEYVQSLKTPPESKWPSIDVVEAALTFVDADIRYGMTHTHLSYDSTENAPARKAYVDAHARLVEAVLALKYSGRVS